MSAAMPDAGAGPALARQGPPVVGRLVVWVGNNRQADALVRHAARLVAGNGATWTVICVELPGAGDAAPARYEHARRALRLAESLGAATAVVHGDSVIAAVAERARRERASTVLIGGHSPEGWLDGLQRPWIGNMADALTMRLPGVAINVVYFPDDRAASPTLAASARRRWPTWPDWLLVVLVVGLCTLISEVMLARPDLASVTAVYLAGVVYIALRMGEAAALPGVIVSILLVDLLVVEPRWSLIPTEPEYYFTFLVMLIVGLVIGRLADRARLQAVVADARARRAQALNELASHLVSAQFEQDIGIGLAAAVRSTFGAAAALLLPAGDGRLSDPAGFCRPATDTDGSTELAAAQRSFDQGCSTETAGGAAGDRLLCLPLQCANGPLGVFVVRPPEGQIETPEDRRLLGAFANQVALALERSLFARRSSAAVVDAESERLRNTLLSGISHDFRTPLTTIVGSATSLLEQDAVLDDAHRRGLLRSILDEARRMHMSMSDLLDLTRMEEGAVQANCEWCPADDLVGEALAALSPRLAQRTVRVQVPATAVVWCDPRLVQQLLVNLLDNALRHTPAHCEVEVRVEPGPTQWRLIVADDGPGLPAGAEQSVFKKFYRARDEPNGTGTGLGLAICSAVARLHGGTIEAGSAGNAGGARFTLTLPQPGSARPALDEAV